MSPGIFEGALLDGAALSIRRVTEKKKGNAMAKAAKKTKRSGGGAPALSQLGQKVAPAVSPEQAILEAVPNDHPGELYLARFTCPEFTALCPVTGQPDFAHFVIDYAPGKWLVESKSLKLYLVSFRNHGAFHEATTLEIGKKIMETVKPKWLRISGFWYPRGGIPIDVFWQTGQPPKDLFIPDAGVAPYRGR